MKEKMNDQMSWNEILTQLAIGTAMGVAFLMLVCCGDAFCRMLGGQ